ncbi:MAG: DDE-type integrase/transposase/recombinase [Gammaproteobacteria bacterium]|nr:DDE-type integrase/transposase/recombinase [Gammaproteobacteria bacterium]
MKPRRHTVRTSDGGRGEAVFPNLARDFTPTGPNQLWVGDITYIRTRGTFVNLAVIHDAWSRRVVGYAVSHRIDARLTIAALRARRWRTGSHRQGAFTTRTAAASTVRRSTGRYCPSGGCGAH